MKSRITFLTLAGISLLMLPAIMPQGAQASDYCDTTTYTFTGPAELLLTPSQIIEESAVIERPMVTEKIIEKPVVEERVIQQPVVVEKPVVIRDRSRHHLLHLGLPLLNFSVF